MAACLLTIAAIAGIAASTTVQARRRDVLVENGTFVDTRTGKEIILTGANVVMKGPPWIPSTDGDAVCGTTPASGSNTSCSTFNAADAAHLTQDLGYNMVRLGVAWAGGQPDGGDALDPAWVARLQAFLELCHAHGIAVILDVHQDAVGSAVCGEGMPLWYSKLAVPGSIGKPVTPIVGSFQQPDGTCGANDTANWAAFAGDPDYNIKNPCCRILNQGNWGALIPTWQAQATMLHLFSAAGRAHYAKYMGLLSAAVDAYPAVVGIELMNEPPSVERWAMYATWHACYDAIRAASPDLAVGVMDTGEAALGLGTFGIKKEQVAWLKGGGTHLFYAFHWYGNPKSVETAVANAKRIGAAWNMPVHLTEFGGYGGPGCHTQQTAAAAGVGSSYWHYDDYCYPKHCPDGAPDGHCPLPEGPRWGACITGWGSGNSSFKCN